MGTKRVLVKETGEDNFRGICQLSHDSWIID